MYNCFHKKNHNWLQMYLFERNIIPTINNKKKCINFFNTLYKSVYPTTKTMFMHKIKS